MMKRKDSETMIDTLKYQIYEIQQYWNEPGKQDSEDVEFFIYILRGWHMV